jgi:hypothetical protein
VSDEPSVLGVLQQWLARVEAKLDHLSQALEGKADRSDLAQLRTEMREEQRHQDRRLEELEREAEHRRRSDEADTEERRYQMPVRLTVALLIVGALSLGAAVVPLVKG